MLCEMEPKTANSSRHNTAGVDAKCARSHVQPRNELHVTMRSMRLMRFAGLILLLGHGPAAFGQTPKLQALILTGQTNHAWRATSPVLRKVLEDTGRFEVRVSEDFRGSGAET